MNDISGAAGRLRKVAEADWPACGFTPMYPIYNGSGWYGNVVAGIEDDRRIIAEAALPLFDPEPITEEWLRSVGGVWDEKQAAFRFNYHRLYLWFRMTGQHWLTFESTYGGNVGTYQRPKARGQLRGLCHFLGIPLKEST